MAANLDCDLYAAVPSLGELAATERTGATFSGLEHSLV